jgi:tRNA threonylcarbamoyladenosine biosynthesis protein TsaB
MTMLLGIESATTRLSVALGDGVGAPSSISVDGDRRHVEILAPTIRDLCVLAGVSLGAVEGIAVDVGPGLFTGMRVGIATAQGLAVALGVPVHPVRSVDVVAHRFRHAVVPVVVVIDARRGEVFRLVHHGGRAQGAVACTTPAEVAAEVALLGPCHVVGDGAVRYRALMEEVAGAVVSAGWPSAEAVIALARAVEPVEPAAVHPMYMRDADAVANFEVAR